MSLDGFEESKIKTHLYNEFYEANKDLFRKNRQEFMRQQRVYVEKGFMDIKYNLKKDGEQHRSRD
jgi:hypothetical protein